jgi:carboxyl-terminal processing protease
MEQPILSRRIFCGASIAFIGTKSRASEPPRDIRFIADFDELWQTLGERYCFFADKRIDWNKVRSLYRPMAMAADSDAAFTDVVRRVLAEFYDPHTHLSNPPDGSPRWPLYDILGERAGGQVRIAAVEEGSAASDAGLTVGDRILAIDGRAIDSLVRDAMPQCLSAPDPAADTYAINVTVAGYRGKTRTISIEQKRGPSRDIALPLKPRPAQPNLESRRLAGGYGYIVIRSFADSAMVAAFDHAMAQLADAPGLIIDVRNNGGGDTAVARPIMGRFITERKAYALMRRREGAGLSAPWAEYIDPRGPFTYSKPVVVLTNHWSGSMAEGFPMGMRDIGRATILGTKMMGLGAAIFPIRLDRSGIEAQYSGEPVYDTNGRPRWMLRPDVEITDGEDILAAGITHLAKARKRA